MTLIWIFVGKKKHFCGGRLRRLLEEHLKHESPHFLFYVCFLGWFSFFFSSRFFVGFILSCSPDVTGHWQSQLLAHVSPTKDFSGCQEDKSV